MVLNDFINKCKSTNNLPYYVYDICMYDEIDDELREKGTYSGYEYLFGLTAEQYYTCKSFLKTEYADAIIESVIICNDAILIFIGDVKDE